MSEPADADMGGVPLEKQHAELAKDSSNVTIASNGEERAAKRLKMDDSATSENGNATETAVPGEGLHDAPSEKVKSQKEENVKPIEDPARTTRPGHVDGRINGVAPVKKE